MATPDKRQKIMHALERLITGGHLREVTLDDVAGEAKVGKGTIYRYFRDKEDLFFQTATSGFDQLCEVLTRRVPREASFEDRLQVACGQISEFHRRRRPLFRMMQSEEARMAMCPGALTDAWQAQRTKLVRAVAGILEAGQAEGRIRPDVPCEILANFLLGMLRTRGRKLANAPKEHRTFQIVTDLFLRGAGANQEGQNRA